MKFVTDQKIKDFLKLTTAAEDSFISDLNSRVSSQVESFCNRKFKDVGSNINEFCTGDGTNILYPNLFPITKISSVKVRSNAGFATTFLSSRTLEENKLDAFSTIAALTPSEFYCDGERLFLSSGVFPSFTDCVLLNYRGGFAVNVDTNVLQNVPEDLQQAVVMQVAFVFQRRSSIGVSSISAQNGSTQVSERLALLSGVKEILENYKRPVL